MITKRELEDVVTQVNAVLDLMDKRASVFREAARDPSSRS